MFPSMADAVVGEFLQAYFTSDRIFVGLSFNFCGLNGCLLFVVRGFLDYDSSDASPSWLEN